MARNGEMPEHCRSLGRAVMAAGRGTLAALVGSGAPVPFGPLSSSTINPTGFPSSYEGVKAPDDVALGLALVVRSLARGRR